VLPFTGVMLFDAILERRGSSLGVVRGLEVGTLRRHLDLCYRVETAAVSDVVCSLRVEGRAARESVGGCGVDCTLKRNARCGSTEGRNAYI
jgi:hypothetical protein